MNLSGNDKNKITGKKYQPVMSITGLNDQGQCIKTQIQDSYSSSNLLHIENSKNFHQVNLGNSSG